MKNPRLIDISGQCFGLWTVLDQQGNAPRGAALWRCKCECGVERVVVGSDLRNGKSTGCGCTGAIRIGTLRRTHGGSNTRIHQIWKNMRARCNNHKHPAFSTWGGRGITICDEWNDFTVFKEWALRNGYADNLSIERIDVNGGYEPSNCKWATPLEQSINRRFVLVNKDGVAWSQIAKANGIRVTLMHSRLHEGWPIEAAATLPKGSRLKRQPTPSVPATSAEGRC